MACVLLALTLALTLTSMRKQSPSPNPSPNPNPNPDLDEEAQRVLLRNAVLHDVDARAPARARGELRQE